MLHFDKILSIIIRVTYKFRVNKVMYYLVRPFFHKKFTPPTTIQESDLRDLLSRLSPDPCNSCICKNTINPQYDLQVIIPVYNTENFIKACINSVLTLKSAKKILITVINDGSTDNTKEILNLYNNIDNIEIISQENKGFSGARNTALNCIKAKYITFLDSDDELNYFVDIDKLIDLADQEKADVVECSYVEFYENKRNYKSVRHKNAILNKAIGLHGFPWGKIFNSKLFSNIHFPEHYWFEDTIMAFIIFPLCKKVITSDSLLYRYRKNPNGITSKSKGKPKSIDSYYITEQLLKDRMSLGLDDNIEFSRQMQHQIKINYMRIKTLKNTNVDIAVFMLTAFLWKKYFSMTPESALSKAFENKDFYAYKLICELYLH